MKGKHLFFGVVLIAVILAGAYLYTTYYPGLLGGEKPEVTGQVFSVKDMESGSIARFETDKGEQIWVYRRTDREIAEINALAQYLVDPRSIDSSQPSDLRTKFRSVKEEYFVFNPITLKTECAVKFSPPSEFSYDEEYTRAPIHRYGHFREPCYGNLFDTAGRVLKIAEYHNEKNLSVPRVDWISSTEFVAN